MCLVILAYFSAVAWYQTKQSLGLTTFPIISSNGRSVFANLIMPVLIVRVLTLKPFDLKATRVEHLFFFLQNTTISYTVRK